MAEHQRELVLEVLKGMPGYMTYSGRFMFGATCAAVTGDSALEVMADIVKELEQLSDPELELDCIYWLLRHARTDGYGLGEVVYWPELEVEPEEEDPEVEA